MWFDAQAELAKLGEVREIDAGSPATLATSATPRPRVAIVADVAVPPATNANPTRQTANVVSAATPEAPEIDSHRLTVGGRVATWTGRVVSLDEWRRLTPWQRHGPNGRQWCGISRNWKQPEET